MSHGLVARITWSSGSQPREVEVGVERDHGDVALGARVADEVLQIDEMERAGSRGSGHDAPCSCAADSLHRGWDNYSAVIP
jgi:hypothetical protein